LLAALELQKVLVIDHEQSVVLLRGCYYQDVERVAAIIRTIFSHSSNLPWAHLLLRCDFEFMGYLECLRFLELAFSLLQSPSSGHSVLRSCREGLAEGLRETAESVMESESTLSMLLVVLALFY
jgi:hypothetical protein